MDLRNLGPAKCLQMGRKLTTMVGKFRGEAIKTNTYTCISVLKTTTNSCYIPPYPGPQPKYCTHPSGLSPEIKEHRKKLYLAVRILSESEGNVVLVKDRLYVNNKIYDPDVTTY